VTEQAGAAVGTAAVKHPGPRADAPCVTLVEPGLVTGPVRSATGGRDGLARARALLDRPATEHAVVLGLLAVLQVPVVLAGGGRSAGALGWFAALAAVAVVVTRPWRRLPPWWTLLAAVLAVAPLAVLVSTSGGRPAAVAATAYGACAATVLVFAGYARTPARRACVAAGLCAGGVAQFGWALVPWWGAGDPSRPMVGTYDWHNQYAASLLAPALLGLAVALSGSRPWRAAGWLAAPLAVAGIVLSTSRATLALLAVGWVVVVAVALLGAGGRTGRGRVASRAMVLSVLAVGLTVLLPGPPLFSTAVSPLSGAVARSAAGETLSSNSTYRTEFWREAIMAFRAHPLTGAGYGRIADDTHLSVPASWAISPLAHSGPLQALGDGGLLLGGPLLLGAGALCAGLLRRLRRLRRPARAGAGPDQLVVRAAAVTGLLMVAHSLVDTDWSYPALAAQLAVVAGVALAGGTVTSTATTVSFAGQDGRRRTRPASVALAAAGVLLLALVAGSAASWGQPFHISDPHTTSGGGHS
jgi:O-antigen ligase